MIIGLDANSATGLVAVVKWLITITSSIAWGVILFTVLLKLITLPFDFWSKYSMRKNSLRMEEMRPELEKLQKQYADNKQLYQQKMMALYKKNGYSMLGSCLPMIFSIVIFIVAINGFTGFATYQNREYFYDMSQSYNAVTYSGFETDDTFIVLKTEDEMKGKKSDEIPYYMDMKTLTDNASKETVNQVAQGKKQSGETYQFYIIGTKDATNKLYKIHTTNGFVEYTVSYDDTDPTNIVWGTPKPKTSHELLLAASNNDSNPIKIQAINNNLLNDKGEKYTSDKTTEEDRDKDAEDWIVAISQTMSAKTFREDNATFLWVKNIWVQDSALYHPCSKAVLAATSCGSCNNTEYINDTDFNNLTGKLEEEKTTPNGYFILVILTAGFSLILQLITTKSQKAQMELQTVNGQGMQTQKIMNWMMPILMAVFAFMYTAAFSIYIILSSVISILSTLAINKIVDVKLAKGKRDSKVIRGRVYTPKEETAEEKKAEAERAKAKKEADKNGIQGDFLKGTVEEQKKYLRGRKK